MSDVPEKVRLTLAKNLMRWRMDDYGDWPQEKADSAIEEFTAAEHSGDCTKQPWTCMRCQCDATFKHADEILNILAGRAALHQEQDDA